MPRYVYHIPPLFISMQTIRNIKTLSHSTFFYNFFNLFSNFAPENTIVVHCTELMLNLSIRHAHTQTHTQTNTTLTLTHRQTLTLPASVPLGKPCVIRKLFGQSHVLSAHNENNIEAFPAGQGERDREGARGGLRKSP